MTPDDVVARLADIVATRTVFTEDDVYDAMSRAGVRDRDADLAYKFTQTAWGRVFLDGLGVQFGTEYLCFNGAGEVVESGVLTTQPHFIAAQRLAPRYASSPGFMHLALMSAEVNTVNSMLNAGSKPENIETGPAAFFLGPATPAGMEEAQRLLTQRMSAGPADEQRARRHVADRKPWWRFW